MSTIRSNLTVSNVAELANIRPMDGDTVHVLGYYAEDDGGGQLVTYKRASTATVNGGTVFNGPGGTGRYIAADSTVVNVKKFGARGDATTDDTAAFEAARDYIASLTNVQTGKRTTSGGYIYIPRGTYIVTEFNLATSNYDNLSLIGDESGTVIRAGEDGKFSVIVPTAYLLEPHFFPQIKNIVFDGSDGTTANKRCGLYVGRRVHLERLTFEECLIGLMSNDNYYGHYQNLNAHDCDVGMWFGTFASGSTTITDLVDGDSLAASVTLPEAAGSSSGHSGNKLITNLRSNGCRLHVIVGGASSWAPRLTFVKPTIEGGSVGIFCYSGESILHDPWTESFSTTTDDVINGITFTDNNALLASSQDTNDQYEHIGGIIRVYGGRIDSSHAELGGRISIDNGSILIAAPTSNSGGGYDIQEAIADNFHIPYQINRPGGNSAGGRSIISLSPQKIQRIYDRGPTNGTLVLSEDFVNSTYTTSSISAAGSSLVFGVEGGLFEELSHAIQSVTSGAGLNLSMSFVDEQWYVVTFSVKVSAEMQFDFVNVAGFLGPDTWLLTPDEWHTISFVGKIGSGLSGTPRLRAKNFVGTESVQWGGIQVVHFPNILDAMRFVEEPYFYMELGTANQLKTSSEVFISGIHTLSTYGPTELDGNLGVVNGMLPDGEFVGQRKFITITDATNSGVVSATNHERGTPLLFIFDKADEFAHLEWGGTHWKTIDQSSNVSVPKNFFGEIYNSSEYTIALPSGSVWYHIRNNTHATGETNGFTYQDDDSTMIIPEDGTYEVSFSISVAGGNNGEYHIGTSLDGANPTFKTQAEFTADAGFEVVSSSFIASMLEDQTLRLMIEDTGDPSQDATIREMNFHVIQIR